LTFIFSVRLIFPLHACCFPVAALVVNAPSWGCPGGHAGAAGLGLHPLWSTALVFALVFFLLARYVSMLSITRHRTCGLGHGIWLYQYRF
jgi:hypothetical protein